MDLGSASQTEKRQKISFIRCLFDGGVRLSYSTIKVVVQFCGDFPECFTRKIVATKNCEVGATTYSPGNLKTRYAIQISQKCQRQISLSTQLVSLCYLAAKTEIIKWATN